MPVLSSSSVGCLPRASPHGTSPSCSCPCNHCPSPCLPLWVSPGSPSAPAARHRPRCCSGPRTHPQRTFAPAAAVPTTPD
eukprot:4952510-Prorocentrum_lima.AAC.1